jgi:hypothetical protein
MATKITNSFVAPQPRTLDQSAGAPAQRQSSGRTGNALRSAAPLFQRDSFDRPAKATRGHIDNDGFVIPNKGGKVAGAGVPASSNVNVKYFGGGVLDKPVVTNMYIGDYFKTAQGQKDVAHNDAFMKDFVQNKDYNSIWHQYGVDTGSTEASHVLGGNIKSNAVITQKQIEGMLQKAIADGTVKPSAQSIFNFVLPPGATLKMDDGSSSKQGLGGFHSSIHTPDGKEVFYAANAYSQGRNGIDFTNGNAQDNISIVESHEISEAATDPHVQDAIDHNNNGELGWMDMNNGEIGDIEVNDAPPGTPLSSMYDRMDGYAVQKMWSQKDNTNEIKAKNPGPVEKLPKPAVA